MKKNNNKIASNANESVSLDRSVEKFEIFKSRVANAVLDYMEKQSDLDLLECLEKSSMFLSNVSVQVEQAFENEKSAVKYQNDLFEVGDDLFSASQQIISNTIH